MKKKRRIENRIIAVILCMAILFSQVNIADAADLNPSGTNTSQVTLSDETNMSNDEASTESTVSDEINGTTESESSISEETNENSKNNESESSNENVKAESTDNIDAYYKDSKICIYNYEQLKQIGSDAYVYTGDKDGKIGSGDVVKSEGTELKYGADAQYILMNDIQMNSEQIWSVPDSFTGTITGTEVEENETPTLYDKETDTIYIYNPYQLMVLAQEESETEPVMSMDYDAPQFGMGQMIYPDGEDKEYLTYSKSHNYVLSQKFNSDKPELVADQLTEKAANGVQWLDGEHADGRTKPGQLYVEVSGKKYILIGNESQLRAIGSNKSVTPTGVIPDTTGYSEYVYKIHDELTKGLDFVNDANGAALEAGATTVNVKVAFKEAGVTDASTAPTTATIDTTNSKKMSLDLSTWVKANQTNKGKEFTVTYYAKVNKDAEVTNNNKASLEYGNNPGDTTTTTPSEAKTNTYPLDINKIKKGSYASTGKVSH